MSQEARDRISECLKTQNPVLNLRHCNLANLNEIPELFECLHLTVLDLSWNQLVDVSGLAPLLNLTTLNLYRNQLVDVSGLAPLLNLTRLDLYRNQLVDVSGLVTLINLTGLDLSWNQLVDVSGLALLLNLSTLELSWNQLVNVSGLIMLPNLTKLNLSSNQLVDFSFLLSNELYRSGRLMIVVNANPNYQLNVIVKQGYEVLKVYYDSLAAEGSIPNDQLKVILLGNSTAGKTSLLRCWRREKFSDTQLTTHGLATPFKILIGREETTETFQVNVWDFGGQDYYHATHRLFITPDSTYVLVCNQVLENKPAEELTTEYMQVGDEVRAVKVPVQHYPYRFWLQMLAALTKVGRLDEADSSATRYSKPDPLFLVENKCGTYERNDRMQLDKNLIATLPFEVIGRDFYHLDIREAWLYEQDRDKHEESAEYFFGYRKFEKKLIETLQTQISENRYPIIKNYPVIRDILAALAAYQQTTEVSGSLNQLLTEAKIAPIREYEKLPVWITYAQYQDLVRRNSSTAVEPAWESLHIYLQNLCGQIFHFHNIPDLAHIVFIGPNWLHQTIYKVLSQKVLDANGEFTIEQADAVIDGNILDASRFLQVMMAFELVFPIIEPAKESNQSKNSGSDKHADHAKQSDVPPRRFVAPQYLPIACPLSDEDLRKEKEEDHELALTLQFEHYLPPALISRIISVKGHFTKQRDPRWRNGLIYTENGLSTLLLCTPEARKIELYLGKIVKGDDVKRVLRQFMTLLEARFSDEIADALISLPGVPGMAKWKHLYRAKKEGRTGAKNYDKSIDTHLVDSGAFDFLFQDFDRKPINIFVCYAHDDHAEMVRLVEPLKKELASLSRQHGIILNPFTDQALRTGDEWHTVLTSKIKENDLLICLLSPSFFTSGYIQKHEYGQVMREIADGQRDSLVAPVYLKPCYVAEANPIGTLQFFKPLPSLFNRPNDIKEFSFSNLLDGDGGSYIDNYVQAFVNSISQKLLGIWAKK